MSTNSVSLTIPSSPFSSLAAPVPAPDKVSETAQAKLVEMREATPTAGLRLQVDLIEDDILHAEEGVVQELTPYDLLLNAILFEDESEALDLLNETGNDDIRKTDGNGNTLLHLAIQKGKLKVATSLLNRCSQLRADGKNNEGITPLHLAARRGFTKLVEVMMRQRPNVDVKDKEDRTPLYNAVWAGHEEVAVVLCRAGANPFIKLAKNQCIIDLAIEKGFFKLAARLLRETRFSNAYIRETTGSSRLSWAVLTRDVALVRQVLKEKDCNVNAKDAEGDTALHIALDDALYDIALELLNAGARFDIPDSDGTIALSIMDTRDSSLPPSIKEFLKKKGIDFADFAKLNFIYNTWEIDRSTTYKGYHIGKGLSDHSFYATYPGYVSDYFRRSAHPLVTSIDATAIADAFIDMERNQGTDAAQLIKEMEEGSYVVLGTGWSGHFTGAVLMKDQYGQIYLGKSNRGDASGETGVEIFRVMKPEHLEEAVKQLSKANLDEGAEYFNYGLEDDLGAQCVRVLPMSEQRASNCPVASTEGMVLNVLYWEFRKKLDHKNALANAQIVLTDFIGYSRERSVAEYIATTLDPDRELLREVLEMAKKDLSMEKRVPAIAKRIEGVKERGERAVDISAQRSVTPESPVPKSKFKLPIFTSRPPVSLAWA